MNVFNKYIIRKMDSMIKAGFLLRQDPMAFRVFKQEINNRYGIFYINYMKTKDSNIYTVMTKRNNSSYVYTYNVANDILILKGERQSVSA